jgi:hypothetical protein
MKDNLASKLKAFYYLVLTALHFYMNIKQITTYPTMTLFYKFIFLTGISYYLNWFYYTIKFLKGTPILNALPKMVEEKSLKKLFRFNFSLSFVVFFLYWCMRLADPKLLFSDPRVVIPVDLDVFLHGGNFGLNFVEHLVIQPESNYENSYKSFFMFLVFYSCMLKIAHVWFGVYSYAFVIEKGMLVYIVVIFCGMLFMLLGDFVFKVITRVNGKRLKVKADE